MGNRSNILFPYYSIFCQPNAQQVLWHTRLLGAVKFSLCLPDSTASKTVLVTIITYKSTYLPTIVYLQFRRINNNPRPTKVDLVSRSYFGILFFDEQFSIKLSLCLA